MKFDYNFCRPLICFLGILCASVLSAILSLEGYIHYVDPSASSRKNLYVIVNACILCLLLFLIIYFFISNRQKNKSHKALEEFRKKISYITTANEITIMQYDIRKKFFTRWDTENNKPFREFSADDYWTHIHPDDISIAQQLMDYMEHQQKEPYSCEYRYLFPGSEVYSWQYNDIFPFEYNSQGKVISYIGFCRRNNKMHSLRLELENFRKQVSLVTSKNGIGFAYYNVATNILQGIDQNGTSSNKRMSLDDLLNCIYPEDISKVKRVTDAVRSHQKEHLHVECRYKAFNKGNYKWFVFDIAASASNREGEITDYIWQFRNNDAWHNTMDEMIDLRDKAESANRIKTVFLENISHEIRTPLNAVIGFSNLITDDISQKEREEYKDIIGQNNKLLLQTIDDILYLSRIESGNIDFTPSNIDLTKFLGSLMDSMQSRLHPNVKMVLKSKKRLKIFFDSKLLGDIISTLLTNAGKFTIEGSITLSYASQEEGLYVSVTDTGVGINDEDKKRIFERFEKVDKFLNGTGVGLAICKALIEQVKGKIGVESELDKGSTFWFWIPCEIISADSKS
jgi:signal transduction histidine kinase